MPNILDIEIILLAFLVLTKYRKLHFYVPIYHASHGEEKCVNQEHKQ